MKLSFSTLGCPDWTLAQICEQGSAAGFYGVDFRGLGPALDITTLPAFGPQLHQTRRMLEDAGLATSGISSGICLCEPDRQTANVEEARRTIEVARGLACPYVRVFGGRIGQSDRESASKTALSCLAAILSLPGASDVQWLLETHDDWCNSSHCAQLLASAGANSPVGLTWDVMLTVVEAQEPPDVTLRNAGDWVRYVHLKDALYTEPTVAAAKLVQPGEGLVPLPLAIHSLTERGFDGWLMFEHEKRWHPELPDPAEALPAFVDWIRRVLALRAPH